MTSKCGKSEKVAQEVFFPMGCLHENMAACYCHRNLFFCGIIWFMPHLHHGIADLLGGGAGLEICGSARGTI